MVYTDGQVWADLEDRQIKEHHSPGVFKQLCSEVQFVPVRFRTSLGHLQQSHYPKGRDLWVQSGDPASNHVNTC